MSSAAYNTPSTMKANTNGLKPVCIDPSAIEYFAATTAAAVPNCAAVALTEPSAAFV